MPLRTRKIRRESTAIARTLLSRPVQLALQSGFLSPDTTFLDYGCGRGDDLRRLKHLGFRATGWDPYFRPGDTPEPADVVNLGYVVNVIEDENERAETLRRAWEMSSRLLIVAARLDFEADNGNFTEYGDGYLSSRGTFQKFYSQGELRAWITSTLEEACVPAAPGIYFVFRLQHDRQSFQAAQYRRSIPLPPILGREELFEQHEASLQPLMEFFRRRGRLPQPEELSNAAEVTDSLGSIRRAFGVVQAVTGREAWATIRTERTQDLTVFLALERFGGRPRFAELSPEIKLDVKAFFGSYGAACEEADELLFSAGDTARVNGACKGATVGKLTREALYLHREALPFIPPVLRAFEGCARAYLGIVGDANVIKLSRLQPKVTYLFYPDFDTDPHPPLTGFMTVHLRNFQVTRRDYSKSENPPILHRKETFVPLDYPGRKKFARLTKQEERWGLYERPTRIGFRRGWDETLEERGVRLWGHRLCRVRDNGA